MTNEERKTITLLSLIQVAEALAYSEETINDWVRAGTFPKPILAMPGSPRRWRLIDIESWIEKRRRARDTKPSARGRLNRGRSLGRFRPKASGQ